MAVDETLFASAEERRVATVRLYGFVRPTLTFGYGQRLEEVCRPDVCRGLGVDCIRRLTGGRALLHETELTYAVASPIQGPFADRSVRGIYAAVSDALSRGLEALGAPLDPPGRPRLGSAAEGRPSLSPVPCLAVPERHEITAGGRKIVASAQRRRRRAFLQHGAILLHVDPALWERVRPEAADRPLEAVGLDELVAPPPTESALRAALASAFTELFGAPPSPDGLDEDESARIARLEAKYRSESWNVQRRSEGG